MDIPSLPPYFSPLPQEIHTNWLTILKDYGMLYLHGIFGYGKTTQALHFSQMYFKERFYFSANDGDFIAQVTDFFANFKKGRTNTLLILDDLHRLTQSDQQQVFFSLLLRQSQFDGRLQIMLLSRGRLPDYLVPLRITQHLAVVDREDLRLSEAQVLALFSTQGRLAALTPTQIKRRVTHALAFSHGNPLGVQVYLQHLIEHPYDTETVVALSTRDIFYALDTQFSSSWPKGHVDSLVRLSVFPTFSLSMAELMLGSSTQALLADFMQLDSFLTFEAPDTYHFHPAMVAYCEEVRTTLDQGTRDSLYQLAAQLYEEQRNFEQALRCYKMAGRTDKVIQLVIYLLENAEGCIFAELSAEYMDAFTPEEEVQNPRIIGARAMLAAYRMEPDISKQYLAKLKEMAQDAKDSSMATVALNAYIRTLVASPCVTAEELKENLLLCGKYVQKNGVTLKNIMPTGNFPSVLNGGLDLLSWAPQQSLLFPVMKPLVTSALGVEGVGAPDAALGEFLYEQGKNTQAMASLTHALSDANFKGSIRVQYAATGVMARLFQSEGQPETAQEILLNIRENAAQRNFTELLPNINTSLIHGALLRQDVDTYTQWLAHDAPDEHRTFYITTRFGLLTKARVYVALGREIEAIAILDRLHSYATLYHRPYMEIELLILRAMILYRRGEDWQQILVQAVKLGQPYQLHRMFADQGIALRPLWKEVNWNDYPEISPRYVSVIGKELGTMASHYPHYLQVPRPFGGLTGKEQAVLHLLSEGANNTQIAKSLEITLGTAKFHVSNIIKKLGAENRTAVVKIAQEQGLI